MKLQAKSQAQVEWQACAEVVALRRASHPFIVRLEQAFQTPEFYVLVMELCPNGNMNHRLCRTQTPSGRHEGLPWDVCARYGGQVLLALLHLHDALGIVYRDVKPENILLSADDEAKLSDFGTAKYVGKAAQARMSFTGTLGFLAPELVMGGSFVNMSAGIHDGGVSFSSAGGGVYDDEDYIDPFKTDAYSFGVTLEVMLLGEDCAELHEEDGELWMLPRALSGDESTELLTCMCKTKRLSPEARDLLMALLPTRPSRRMRLADTAVRRHPFFLRALCCDDLAARLLPAS